MIIAVPVTGNQPSGPGEAMEVVLFDTDSRREIERYENPALTASSGRGIAMIRSVMERKADALVVGGIGQHAFEVARRNIRVLNGAGMSLEEILNGASSGTLAELSAPNH